MNRKKFAHLNATEKVERANTTHKRITDINLSFTHKTGVSVLIFILSACRLPTA